MKSKTRAISLILALMLCMSFCLPVSAAGSRFTDVPDGAWYAEAVNAMADGGVLNGKGNGIFDPNANVTLAELSVIYCRLTGWDEEDMAWDDHWAGNAMLVTGLGTADRYVEDGDYYYTDFSRANDPAYRGDALSLMGDAAYTYYYIKVAAENNNDYNLAYEVTEEYAAKGFDLSTIADRDAYYAVASDVYDDEAHIYKKDGHWFQAECIDWAYQFGVATGKDANHTCDAMGTLTRAELAQMCYNMGWITRGSAVYS